VESGGFWEGKTRTALQALLHAAALDQRTQRDLFGWTLAPSFAADTVAILASHPHAAAGWGVSLALSSLADPRVLDTVTPEPGEQFDPAEFLTSNGTGYLLATGARLDPPLFTALDEIGNLASLPSLPMLMAEGGGTGITTMPILQSVSQARDRWGDHAAGAIGDASIVKVILGGASAARDLQDLSALIAERDERTDSITVGEYGSRSLRRSTRRVPVMPHEAIRTLPFGTGLVLLRNTPPVVISPRPWTSRKDAASLSIERIAIEHAHLRR
jgi:type IV secretion system protein VirD4